jgi:hypothetical protein
LLTYYFELFYGIALILLLASRFLEFKQRKTHPNSQIAEAKGNAKIEITLFRLANISLETLRVVLVY